MDQVSDHRPVNTTGIDRVLAHKIWGLPIFIGVVFLVFFFTFVLGSYPVAWIEALFSWLKEFSYLHIAQSTLRDLVVNGIISGVGGVAVYLPNIILLFLFISLMEDSGYAARTSMLVHSLMKRAGLRGNSFIPLMMGFGCNVPAIMATRSIDSRRDRLIPILIIPFMSCSAKLPVYILFISAFFPNNKTLMLFGIYLLGISVALVTALLLSKTFLKKQEALVSLGLPPYRVPGVRIILRNMWQKTMYFIKKMGGIILVASIIIWVLGYFPVPQEGEMADRVMEQRISDLAVQGNINAVTRETGPYPDMAGHTGTGIAQSNLQSYRLENSYIGKIGKWIQPVFRPLGFDWKMSVSLLTGLPAKEIVVSTLAILYSSDTYGATEVTISQVFYSNLGHDRSALVALSFMIFILMSFPCIGTLTAIRRETGKVGWMMFNLLYTTGIAWIISFAVYQAGSFIVQYL